MTRHLFIAWTIAVLGCGGNEGGPPAVERRMPTQEELIEENRSAVRLEERDIDRYVRRHGHSVQGTGSGVRYQLVRSLGGERVRPGQWALVNYRAVLLNGDTAYASEPGRPEAFKVEMDDVESGLHEAIQYLGPGDSAVIIIPSYRAHGLLGDQRKIPMRSTVVYHLGLVKASGNPMGR
jgi:FKBP-type peptidyl-prolyl cis-trans isomerase FkpA